MHKYKYEIKSEQKWMKFHNLFLCVYLVVHHSSFCLFLGSNKSNVINNQIP